MSATIAAVAQTYGVRRWGDGYFGITADGHACVRPRLDSSTEIDLYRLAREIRNAGLSWPVLVRFNDILHSRVRSLCKAFDSAGAELGFRGGYRAIYPIKVNQQRSVVEEIVRGGGDWVGLEAGSKPELMVVLALSRPGAPIVCNGYKDREYIRLALIGRKLGHDVYIVIEKPSELDLVIRESAELGIEPLLGVRVRLAAVASGNWQNSGGAKSKFGLSAAQLLDLVERLRTHDLLHCLVLLHSHIGSQIPNLRDIGKGAAEAARYFGELHALGVPLRILDVGGGLGVDYEGTGSRHYCSVNYSLEAYAREVLQPITRICAEQGLPQPCVFSESGRALTAHHAMLITNVIEREPAPVPQAVSLGAHPHPSLQRLQDELDMLDEGSPVEVFQEAAHVFEYINDLFERGEVGLAERAQAEQLYFHIAEAVRRRLNPASRRHRELLDTLNEMLAEKIFCNFSLFQSIPDVWAIQQIFPLMPLHRLDEAPEHAVLVHDLTCDSDGCIENYVDQDGVESTLMLHAPSAANEPYLLGIFLVGAYQEILGDMHNLFGDTDAVNVVVDDDGSYYFSAPERGDSVDELLRYVHFDPDTMLTSYSHKLRAQGVGAADLDRYYQELKAGLHGYTYFED